MRTTVTATAARVRFGELMRRVAENGETVIVERGGKRTIVILPVAEYERLMASDVDEPDWMILVDEVRDALAAERGGLEFTPAADVIRAAREDRDVELTGLR